MKRTNEHGVLHARAQLQILTAEFLSDQCAERAEQIAPRDEPIPDDPALEHDFWHHMRQCAEWLSVAQCFEHAYHNVVADQERQEKRAEQ